MNWELDKRLRESTLVITHHDELKELVVKVKHFADVATANQECHEKIYKIYSDNQIVTIVSLTTQDINKDQYSNTLSLDWKFENS